MTPIAPGQLFTAGAIAVRIARVLDQNAKQPKPRLLLMSYPAWFAKTLGAAPELRRVLYLPERSEVMVADSRGVRPYHAGRHGLGPNWMAP